MASRRVRCPACAVILEIPHGFRGSKVVCSCCQGRFRIPALSDAEIVDLIGHRDKDDTTVAGTSTREITAALVEARQSDAKPGQAQADDKYKPVPAELEGFTLARLDSNGVLFEFPASLLAGTVLRGALPRCCMRCGTKGHLQPHLAIFAHHMTDSASLEVQFVDGPMIDGQDAMNMPIEEVLEKLPRVKRVPSPANLPMPYWICDQCSPSNMVLAQNDIDRDTGAGACRLLLPILWRAEKFVLNLGCDGTAICEEIRKAVQDHPEEPWDSLAGVVQQRLRQWYHPHKAERFVSYTPDRSHGRSEDGVYGVVVSNRRLILNCDRRHYESEKGEPIELSFSMQGGQLRLTTKTPNWTVKNQVVDKAGLERLRRALANENFLTTWH